MLSERGIKLDIKPEAKKKASVFYSENSLIARDIAEIAFTLISKDKKEFNVADAMAGSGIRTIRYARHSNANFFINDNNPKAIEAIKRNLQLNNLNPKRFSITKLDVREFFAKNRVKFNFVDLDCFGSPLVFIDLLSFSLRRESYVSLMATDVAALCGNATKACFRKYFAKPLYNSFKFETGLRILLAALAYNFARNSFAFFPLISYYHKYFYHVIAKLKKSNRSSDKQMKNIKFLNFCNNCLLRFYSGMPKENCECNSRLLHAFPVWSANFFDKEFVLKAYKKALELKFQEAASLLSLISEEEINTPFYTTTEFAKKLNVDAPKINELILKLRKSNHKATRTHFSSEGFRTNALPKLIETFF